MFVNDSVQPWDGGEQEGVVTEWREWGAQQQWASNLGGLGQALRVEFGLRPRPRCLLFFLSPT